LKAYALGEITCLPSEPTVGLDLVTADFVVDAIHALAVDQTTIGRCFHLCAGKGNLTTMAEIIESASRYFDRERLVLLSPGDFERFRSRAKNNGKLSDRLLMEELDMYVAYLNNQLHFDDTNARASLEKAGIQAPRFNGYFAKMAACVRLGD
jgi:hypothetical protein